MICMAVRSQGSCGSLIYLCFGIACSTLGMDSESIDLHLYTNVQIEFP